MRSEEEVRKRLSEIQSARLNGAFLDRGLIAERRALLWVLQDDRKT